MPKLRYVSDMPHSQTRLVVDTDEQRDRVSVYTTGTTSALIDAFQAEGIVKQLVTWLAMRAALVPPLE
jgi:hypothetical protein